MKTHSKLLIPALAAAATVAAMLATPASAQVYAPQGRFAAPGPRTHMSVDGPLYYQRHLYNGTGTLPDVERDPHNDR